MIIGQIILSPHAEKILEELCERYAPLEWEGWRTFSGFDTSQDKLSRGDIEALEELMSYGLVGKATFPHFVKDTDKDVHFKKGELDLYYLRCTALKEKRPELYRKYQGKQKNREQDRM